MSLTSQDTTTTTSSFSETMQSFTPGQCLLCPSSSPSFSDSIAHMQKSHSLFIPHQEHLAVDLETLIRYLHLVIFGYRECIQCGTERATVQAVQQHMLGKGHCRFDITEEDSEYAEFYDFEDSAESDVDEENNQETTTNSSQQKQSLPADEDSIHLPSGKTISKKSSAQAEQSLFNRLHRRTTRTLPSQLEYSAVEPDEEENKEVSETGESQALSRREKREKAMITHQLANMTANDRSSLMHLPPSQQRAMLVAQHRHADKTQKEEKRRQTRIDRKGNKNLYAYWNTETPVYQCG